MKHTKTIGFLTSSELSNLTEDDRLAIEPLARRGILVEPVIWDSPTVQWQKFDLIVVRSCWDYYIKPRQFMSWLDAMKQQQIPLMNSVDVIQWNMNKVYLKDLEKKGFVIPPTIWIEEKSKTTLAEILKGNHSKKYVIKPTISGSAYKTWVVADTITTEDEVRFQSLISNYGVMAQKFMDEITTTGEWSMMFFNKQYSHTVLKKVKKDDFRVQSDFGGTVHPLTPSPLLLKQAQAIINTIPESLLYARVDGIDVNGKLVLMELEILEPALFLHADPKAPERFADAIANSIQD